jgi:glycosyltransferase involved in cell wall biosynthesis
MSPAAPPKLSVIIACRDAQDVLGVQLAALARQQCPVPWELLVCDNGSRDRTVSLARTWSDRLPLRIVDASDIVGAGPARNAGVRAAAGEWLGFCDADDEVAEGWLETLCSALASHPFVAGRFEGTRLNSARTLSSRTLDQHTDLQLSSPAVGLPHAGAGNLGIRRSVFLEVGGFDPAVRYLQDTDLCWRVQLAGHPLIFVPELEVHVRLRSTLRSMYQQGRNYGVSQASLERRYSGAAQRVLVAATVATPATAATVAPPASSRAGTATWFPGPEATRWLRAGPRLAVGALRLARFFVRQRSSVAAQVWQFGWHVGHRS